MRKMLAGAIAAVCLSPVALRAEVVRFDIVERVPAFAGRSFGDVGPYERITARATIALNPSDDRNAVITDLAQAPRSPDGKVEAIADVVILRPADPTRGNGTLLLDVPNRGRKLAPQLFDDSSQPGANNAQGADDAGIGFLHRQGYTMVWVGWQGDIPSKQGQMALTAPVLKGVTGPAREEFVFDTTTKSRAGNPDLARGRSRQPQRHRSRRLGRCAPDAIRPLGPPRRSRNRRGHAARRFRRRRALRDHLHRARSGAARDGLCRRARCRQLPAPRYDIGQSAAATACIRRRAARSASASRNPAASCATSFISASTRISHGRVVFDGLMPHVAGTRRMATNVRFGLPGRNPRHQQDPAWQADLFPFTYATLSDPISGKTDGLLRRCALSVTCPKVMQTDSEHEWWASRASLLVTDLAGNHLDLPDNVRAYMIAGTPHFAAPSDVMRKGLAAMSLPQNPMHAGAPMRALLTDLNAWISDGVPPPSSRVPMRAHGTLVAAEAAVRGDIPGLPYKAIHTLAAFSDQSVLPPKEIGRYPVFVPKADDDGMAISGVRQLALAVPRATYTAWNPRAQGFGPTALYPLQGAVVPFAPTEAARKEVHDPRLSIAERYADNEAYVAAVRREATRQVAERLLLPEDAERAVEAAKQGKLAKLGQ